MKRPKPTAVLSALLFLCAPCNPTFGGTPAIPAGATEYIRLVSNPFSEAIRDERSNTSRIRVSSLGGYLWDVDVVLELDHGRYEDLDVRLTSPRGTTVVLSTDNQLGYATPNTVTFDDQAADPVTDWEADGFPSEVAPEGALSALEGEDPNGWWTLECADDAQGFEGSFTWSLRLTTIDRVPREAWNYLWTDSIPVPITDGIVVEKSVTPLPIPPALCLWSVTVRVKIQHDSPNDLAIYLEGPGGRIVKLSSDNGTVPGFYANALFSDRAPVPVSDIADGDVIGPDGAIPQGSLAGFVGELANGLWTLRVADRYTGGTGTLEQFSLELFLCEGVPPTEILCEGAALSACPCGNAGHPDKGCANAFHSGGAFLRAEIDGGVAHAASGNEVELVASDMQPFSWCLFLQGNGVPGGGDGAPFGDGLLCVAGDVIRLGAKPTFLGGADYPGLFDVPLARRADLGQGSHVYQAIFRTPTSWGPCGASGSGVNSTNAVRILWVP